MRNSTAEPWTEQVSGTFHQVYESSADWVREAPFSAILVAFGAGVALGFAVAAPLADALRDDRSTRWQKMARRFGHRLENYVPESVSRHFSR